MYVLSMTWVKLLTEFYRITTRVVFYGSHSLHSLCGLPARDVSGSGDQATIMVFCRWLAFLGEVPMSLYDRVQSPRFET